MTKPLKPEKRFRSRYMRLRAVEDLYLNGYRTREIYAALKDQHKVTAGTIRNDIVTIRKRWGSDLKPEQIKDARDQYIGSLYSIRRRAMPDPSESDQEAVKTKDLKLAHELDKEIARICGVSLKSDTKNLAITVEKAKEYLDLVMGVIFAHVTDEDTRELIITDLALIDGQI